MTAPATDAGVLVLAPSMWRAGGQQTPRASTQLVRCPPAAKRDLGARIEGGSKGEAEPPLPDRGVQHCVGWLTTTNGRQASPSCRRHITRVTQGLTRRSLKPTSFRRLSFVHVSPPLIRSMSPSGERPPLNEQYEVASRYSSWKSKPTSSASRAPSIRHSDPPLDVATKGISVLKVVEVVKIVGDVDPPQLDQAWGHWLFREFEPPPGAGSVVTLPCAFERDRQAVVAEVVRLVAGHHGQGEDG